MRDLRISCGASFFDAPALQTFTWPALVGLLRTYDASAETLETYLSWSKDAQLKAKDRGWFNGNQYSRPERHGQYITGVDLLTLDIDNGDAETTARIVALFDPVLADDGFAYFLGSTRKHTPDKPRLRLVVPLTRTVTVDEADALKRMIAFRIGMPAVDTVSFRANQVMFWPSRCADGQVFTHAADGEWLDPDTMLRAWYPNGWEHRESWPLHPREESGAIGREQRKAGDPREKAGIIGLWCRTYSITEVLTTFLADEFTEGTKEDRWTHIGGTAGDGAIVYGDDLWLYSHHQTDPGTGQLLNAWDLVRVHKFGTLDAKCKPGAPINSRPSNKAMIEFAGSVPEFKRALAQDAASEFSPITPDSTPEQVAAHEEIVDLGTRVTFNKAGEVHASHANLVTILTEHPDMRGALGYNTNSDVIVWRRFMPWHDETRQLTRSDELEGLLFADIDYVRLREWLGQQYRMELPALALLREVVDLIADHQRFHPIRDYLRSLAPWDGVPRIDTLFIRYLGVEDTPYHRASARMLLVGMVKRVMEPGCKFDTVVLLIGNQRIRKSAFLEALVRHKTWFTDDMKKLGTDAVASVSSLWLVELAELAVMGAAEQEEIKAFLSRRVDRARLSYRRNVQNYPRQCVFTGTTNINAPLKDPTGNGRYHPIFVSREYHELTKKLDIEGLDREVEQLHAEALVAWQAGERVYITDAAAAEGAHAAQNAARPEDPTERAINGWLDGELPSRRSPSGGASMAFQEKGELRFKTCIAQIACEALGYDETGKDWPRNLSQRIIDHLHARTDWGPSKGTSRLAGYGKPRVYVRFGNSAPAESNRDSSGASSARKTIEADDL